VPTTSSMACKVWVPGTGHHGKSYTIGVSAGRAETFTATDAQHDDGFGGGIKATTMITQHVECGGSNKKRLRGAS
jgi:hypothetical protein